MSIALYRRYRPDTFQDVIGQDHVVKPLMAALRSGRISHAYLFSGPRGCGKTTSARIMARCLNCAEGPTDTPCGKCESCKDLATGGSGSLDVVEIDAASHNGVDDARELRERAGFAPVRDRYKIFILDEAHMVTQQGFNALLKIVEEPPEHVKFIFATTEPDKVIGTIRSRTHHYPFRLVPPEIMEKYMAKLCQAENIEPAPGVLQLVMRAGAGSVRDSLSVLDQLMAGAEDGKLAYGTASALLGYTDSSILERSVDAIIDRDGAALFEVIAKMIEGGHDPRRYLEDLLLRLRDLLVLSVSSPEDAQAALAGAPEDQLAVMNAQAQRWGTAGISHASDLTNTALTELTGATAPRLQVELLAARLLLPPESPVTTASGQGAVPSGSLSGPEAAMAALHRSGRPHSSQSPRVPEANRAVPSGSAPRPISAEESGVKSSLSAPPANAPAIAPRSSAPELTAPRPAASPEKQVAPGVAAPSVQSPETGNSNENQGEASAEAPKKDLQTQAASEVEKGEQYWQVLQAWGKVSKRLIEVDSRLWSTCNRHLQIGGAQNQKLTLLADSPQTVEYLKDKLAPLEKCVAEELSGIWNVKLLAGSNDSFAPALSEVLSQVKLLLSPENAPGIEDEAPPEEEFYPPEPEDFGAGSGEEISAPTDSASPAQSSETTALPEGPTPKSADKATKEVNQVADSDSFASSGDSWIIDQTAPPSDKETPKAPATVNPQPQVAPEVAARVYEEIAALRPGEEMAAPRAGSSQMPEAAPRAEVNEVLAARRAGNEPFAAPRPQENTAQENGTASEPSAAPEIAEDLPDMSDPDVGVDDSGGRWGVEVAKSLLGGKIVETADNDSPSN